MRFYLFLPAFAWCDHKIVLQIKKKQFYDHIMQKLVKTGKYTEINKQSNVKFWLNGKKYGIISYSLSCTFLSMEESIFYILKTPKYCQIYKSL